MALRIAEWNIRTLLDLQPGSRPRRRTALIAHELNRYKVDIAALSETRLSGADSLTEVGQGYTFFWKGYEENQPRNHGIGFAVRTQLLSKFSETPVGISPRLMTWRIPLAKHRFLTLISAYAPTLDADDERKEEFYEALDRTMVSIAKDDKVILLGDFNARVGRADHIWPRVIGKQGMGKMNSNGLRLLSLCSEHNLVITNTTFQLKNKYKATWIHPRSKHGHQIDYIITRQSDLKDVQLTRVMRGAECSTDHFMLLSKFKLKMRPLAKLTRPTKRIDTKKLKDQETRNNYREKLAENLNNINDHRDQTVNETWNDLKSALKDSAEETLGFKTRNHKDWFDQNDAEIKQLIAVKNRAHDAWLSNPSSVNLKMTFQNLRKEIQIKLREMENSWWTNQARELQHLADKNDQHGFYNGLKEIYGPTKHTLTPVRSQEGELLKDKTAILNRWAQHFQTLLNHNNPINPDIIEQLPVLPQMVEMDNIPTFIETINAIKSLKNNKSPGPDNLPSELFKEGGNTFHSKLHELVCLIWEREEVPVDFLTSDIVTIYKNKGDRSLCDNSRGISLLPVACKILTRIMLIRLVNSIAEIILPETQCAFRKDRSTCDMIFSIRQLQEKCNEHNLDFFAAFIDLAKAFDTILREVLWLILEKFGTPPKFLSILEKLHENTQATVLASGERSEPFNINAGVKQGCVIAPVIFNIFIAAVTILCNQSVPDEDKISIEYRLDGSLFNVRRLQAHTKTSINHILELQYADDCALVAHTPEALQRSLNVIAGLYQALGLKMNTNKTEILCQRKNPGPPITFTVNNEEIKQVNNFKYLGSIITVNHNIDEEICSRINKAAAAYGRLRARVFQNENLKLNTKVSVYTAVCISTLLYGAETWTVYKRHLKQLESFHIKSLQKILNLTWRDKIPHTQIIQRANTTTIETMLAQKQLRWTGHVYRMGEDRIPRQLLYGQLPTSKRSQGGQMKRYKDQIKTTMKKCRINPSTLEANASERSGWRSTCKEGLLHHENTIHEAREAKRQRRHNQNQQAQDNPELECPECGKVCGSRIGLHSHLRWHRRHQH